MLGDKKSGIKDRFFEDIRMEYQLRYQDGYQDEDEKPFLYKYIEEESLENAKAQAEKWQNDLEKDREGAIEALLKDPNENRSSKDEKTNRRRSDFFEELWLNDAGLEKGLITKRDYYIWLVEYLKSHDTYYNDGGIIGNRGCLADLLKCALSEEERKGAAGRQLKEKGMNKEFAAECLKRLSDMLRGKSEEEAAEVLGPLYRDTEYLKRLTGKLREIAVHRKVRTFLQNSGYPLRLTYSKRKEEQEERKKRKQDFTMNLFDAYCESKNGYLFVKRTVGDDSLDKFNHYDDNRFYYLVDKDDRKGEIALLKECIDNRQKEDEEMYDPNEFQLFIPLVVDAVSGCIFALVGKGNYKELYGEIEKKINEKYSKLQDEEKKSTNGKEKGSAMRERLDGWKKEIKEYEKSECCCCFDYLHLDTKRLHTRPHQPGAAYRLYPRFHKIAGKGYEEVLEEFKRYCIYEGDFDKYKKWMSESLPGWMHQVGKNGAGNREEMESMSPPREAIRNLNLDVPEGIPSIFEAFFCAPEKEPEKEIKEHEVSEEAQEAFGRLQKKAEEEMRRGVFKG